MYPGFQFSTCLFSHVCISRQLKIVTEDGACVDRVHRTVSMDLEPHLFFGFSTAHSLIVTVRSSSDTYHVATSVTLTCRVGLEAVQPVTYQWSSSCSGQCSVAGQTDNAVTISLLQSIDSGTYTCTVTDNVGNTGNGSLHFNATGKFTGEERRIL